MASPSHENLQISDDTTNTLAATKGRADIHFLNHFFYVWQKNRVSAESPEPQLVSRRPWCSWWSACFPLQFLEVETQLKVRCASIHQRSWQQRNQKITEEPRPEFQLVLWGKVSVWSWESQALRWLIFIQRERKTSLLISSRVVRVPISFLRNAHFSSSRNFPLPDIPHQIRWNRCFSFGKRLESCFILLVHFSVHFEKSQIYLNRMKTYLTALEFGVGGEKLFKYYLVSTRD